MSHAVMPSAEEEHRRKQQAQERKQKEQEANNFLEKRYKAEPNPSLSYDDTVQLALACLQNVLGSDLKAGDVEKRVITDKKGRKRVMLAIETFKGHPYYGSPRSPRIP